MKRLILMMAGLLISIAAHAGDMENRFYHGTIYMLGPYSPGEIDCAAIDGRPAGLWGNRENVKQSEKYIDGGSALIVSGIHEDGSKDSYYFFLNKSDCKKSITLARSLEEHDRAAFKSWFFVSLPLHECIAASRAFPGVSSPEDFVKYASTVRSVITVQYNGPDIAMLIDKSGERESMGMVRGKDMCIAVMKIVSAQQ